MLRFVTEVRVPRGFMLPQAVHELLPCVFTQITL